MRPAAAAVLLAAALIACTKGGPGAHGNGARDTLRLDLNSEPRTLNPVLQSNTSEQFVGSLAFDTLLDADAANRLIPRLAAEVPSVANGGISRDGKTIVFHLRPNVTWQDGAPLTSADVAYTVRAILDPAHNVSNRVGYDHIARTDTPDPLTVVFHLKSPYAPFLAAVGYGDPIVPEHLLARSTNFNQDAFGANPVGSGPYRFVRWNRGSTIEYEANPRYFGGPPALAHVSVAITPDFNTAGILLREHQVDFGTMESSIFGQLRGVKGLTTKIEPDNDFIAYAFNTTGPIMHDPRVRHAFAKALDRDAIVRNNTYGTGTVAYADLPAVLWTSHFPPAPDAYDPAGARRLLDAAGWTPGPDGIRRKDGRRLTIRLIDYSGSVTGRNEDVQVQSMMRAVGMDVSLQYFNPSLYYAPNGPLSEGKFDAADVGFVGGVDPQDDELFTCANRAPHGDNFARYCSPQMDALQDASLREYDPVKRRASIAAIEALALRDAPYAFSYYTPWRIVEDPALRRPVAGLTNPWYDVAHWTFGMTR